MILCIGPKNAGKTLLLRKMQQTDLYCNQFNEIFSTVPTVGVNIANIALGKNKMIKITELGGTMAPIWPMHYEDCKGVIYLIDAANMQQVSCATILLLEAIKHNYLQNAKFLVVFNKTDITSSLSISELKYLLRIEEICLHAKQEIDVIESSCVTSKGIKEIKQWLFTFVT